MAGKTVRIARRPVSTAACSFRHQRRYRRGPHQDGAVVAKSQVRLPTGPIKTVGEHIVAVAPHTDVVVDVTVVVVAQTD